MLKSLRNQVVRLPKLALAIDTMARIADQEGPGLSDHDALGEALIRAGVRRAGRGGRSVEEALAEFRSIPNAQDRSHEQTARGLLKLFGQLGMLERRGPALSPTPLGRRAAAYAGADVDEDQKRTWRRAFRSLVLLGAGGERSHPYDVLLRLVERRPGIPKSRCALALEALDDSDAELDRIVRLADLRDDATIRDAIRVRSDATWDNAIKVIPSVAEQIGDIIVDARDRVWLNRAGEAGVVAGGAPPIELPRVAVPVHQPVPLQYQTRPVTPETIAQFTDPEAFDETIPPALEPPDAAAAAAARRDRTGRHHEVVRSLARALQHRVTELRADPVDCLGIAPGIALLAEVKTLDGTAADERERVREAVGQLYYYARFTDAAAGGRRVVMIACFESEPSANHVTFALSQGSRSSALVR